MHIDEPPPRGNITGFVKCFRADAISGFLVFLIALPLSIGISLASGFPPLAGIFTGIAGALIATSVSNSEMAIKGSAAGLIVIVLGCVSDFGGNGMAGGWSENDTSAYQAAMAVGVAAAIVQICFGMLRAGILGEFFPGTVVHGMLAAIGVIIISKQIPVALGITDAEGEPLALIRQIPDFLRNANPEIAGIGLVSLAIMFLWPIVRSRITALKRIPSHLVVLLVAIPLGVMFDLTTAHQYEVFENKYQIGEQYLVTMPTQIFGMFNELRTPDFAVLGQLKAWKWVFMFFAVGSLESLLSAKAIDLLDPWKRKSNMNRDIVAVGLGNLVAAMIGGLPMITEIVRSKSNIDNGGKTRFANLWHGVFLLLCVGLMPTLLHRIPMAALAAMLVYTGTRLAHPSEFQNVYRIGKEQLLIFLVTMITVLATDLLIGVVIGIVVKIVLHLANGVPIRSFFKAYIEVEEVDQNTSRIIAKESAIFSNWIPFKRQIEDIGLVQRRNIVLDLSDTKLVDASVMDKLEELTHDFEQASLRLEIVGLDEMRAFSASPRAARTRGLTPIRRITIVADPKVAARIVSDAIRLGVTGYTAIPCFGVGRRQIDNSDLAPRDQTRLEIIASPDVCTQVLTFLRDRIGPEHQITTCVETVEVPRVSSFSHNDAISLRNS